MTRPSSGYPSSIALMLIAAMSLAAMGCTADLPGTGSGGAGGQATTSTSGTTTGTTTGGTTTGGGGSGGEQPFETIALLNMQIPQIPDTTKDTWLDLGEKLDPTTLLVLIGTESQACNAPVIDLGTEEDHHQIFIGLPQALWKVGKYDLSSTEVIAHGSSFVNDTGIGMSTTLTEGTVKVLSIDVSTISVRLEGLPEAFTLLNGDHLASICPTGV